jgi:nucleotide-binding universal stress UspA family protein
LRTIVVGFDDSDQGRDALQLGEAMRTFTGARLAVVSVDEIEPLWGDVLHWGQARREYYETIFTRARAEVGHEDFDRVSSAGSVPAALTHIAEVEGADLIVVGSSHRGEIGRVLLGSVGARITKGAPCAVAIAPRGYGDRGHPPIGLIGVGYDGRDEARAALLFAASLARQCGARIRLLAVAPVIEKLEPMKIAKTVPGYARYQHRHLTAELGAAAKEIPDDVDAETALLDGDPVPELANAGVELDLLVIGSRGYGPVRRVLLGGVSHALMGQVPCPLLIVPRGSGQPGQEASEDAEPQTSPA